MKEVRPIFYIEDTVDDANLFLRAAERDELGIPIHIFKSAEEARLEIERAALTGQLPCLIMVDLTLPRESGYSLIRWLRSLPPIKNIPILAISGKYAFESVDTVYDAGANVFLVKPSKPDEWGRVIDRLKKFCN